MRLEALIFISALQLATCVAAEANPAVNITWLKNNKPLLADGNGTSFFFLVIWSELYSDVYSCGFTVGFLCCLFPA